MWEENGARPRAGHQMPENAFPKSKTRKGIPGTECTALACSVFDFAAAAQTSNSAKLAGGRVEGKRARAQPRGCASMIADGPRPVGSAS
eukprot:80556-Rhodomonas_salina.1